MTTNHEARYELSTNNPSVTYAVDSLRTRSLTGLIRLSFDLKEINERIGDMLNEQILVVFENTASWAINQMYATMEKSVKLHSRDLNGVTSVAPVVKLLQDFKNLQKNSEKRIFKWKIFKTNKRFNFLKLLDQKKWKDLANKDEEVVHTMRYLNVVYDRFLTLDYRMAHNTLVAVHVGFLHNLQTTKKEIETKLQISQNIPEIVELQLILKDLTTLSNIFNESLGKLNTKVKPNDNPSFTNTQK